MSTLLSDWAVLGQANRVNWDPRFLTTSLWIVGLLLVGAVIIALVSYWRKSILKERNSPSEQLAHFRNLREEGKISPEEFEALRLVLGGRIRKEIQELDKAASGPIETPPVEKPVVPPPPSAESEPKPGSDS